MYGCIVVARNSELEAEEKSVSDLEKRVTETEANLVRIQKFVEHATVHAGKITHNVTHSDRSEITWVLGGFYDFDFRFESGEHTIYGTDIYISYLGKQVVQFHEEPSGENGEFSIKIYDKGPWEEKLEKLMADKNLVENYAREKKAAEEQKKKDREEQTKKAYELEARRRKLEEKAKNLGLKT